jgi:hypothetical protein
MIFAFRPESVVLGVGLIALGVLWTLANMGTLELLPTLRTWWPATLVFWGALELMAWAARRPRGSR